MTPRTRDLVIAVADLTRDGVGPSYQELAQALGLASRACIHRLVTQAEREGQIERLPGRARTLRLTGRAQSRVNPQSEQNRNSFMRLTPEQALLRAEARAQRRALDKPARHRSPSGKALDAAFDAYASEHGPHAAGAWASAKAGPLMAQAHPRGVAAKALRARAEQHFGKGIPHAQEG